MKKKIGQLIAFIIATILTLTHIIEVLLKPSYVNADGETVTYNVVDSVFYGSIGLGITLILIMLNKNAWKYTFTLLLILAFTPFIGFYNRTFSFGIGIIEFELTVLSLLILHLLANPDILHQIKTFVKTKDSSIESPSDKFESTVKLFETKFQNKSTIELEKILNNNLLVPEAIEAARRLLKKDN
jgi:hypothetical protein